MNFQLKIYINGISIYNNYKSSFSFFKRNLLTITSIILGNEKHYFQKKHHTHDNSFIGLIKSFYLLNTSLMDNEIVDLFKPQENKQIIFTKAFYLNPFVLLNKIKFDDKNRIYSFSCSENQFIVENDSFTHRILEKPNFFNTLFKNLSFEEIKLSTLNKKELETKLKFKGVFVLERFRFRETLLGMGNFDIFLFLIENLAFAQEFTDNLFWFFFVLLIFFTFSIAMNWFPTFSL